MGSALLLSLYLMPVWLLPVRELLLCADVKRTGTTANVNIDIAYFTRTAAVV